MAVFATLTYAVAALLAWAQIASAFVAVPSNFAISAPHGLVRRLAESAPNRDRRSSSRDTSKRRDPSSRDSGGDGAGNAPRKDMRNGGAGYKGPSGSFDRGKKSPSQESAFEKLSSSERLQKVIAHAGVASRRAAESMIIDGRVLVNGLIMSDLGVKVNPRSDRITVDGVVLSLRPSADVKWVVLYKPKGAVTTTNDEKGRATVVDLVPGAERSRLLPVGRLDRNTAGVLLLTNDNAWLHALTHPSHGFEKHYRCVVEGSPNEPTLVKLRKGLHLPDEERAFAPCGVDWVPESDSGRRDLTTLKVSLREGRNRQVRRMMEHVGHPVFALTRTAFGPVTLKGMSPGEWRELDSNEVSELKARALPKAATADTGGSDTNNGAPKARASNSNGSSRTTAVPSTRVDAPSSGSAVRNPSGGGRGGGSGGTGAGGKKDDKRPQWLQEQKRRQHKTGAARFDDRGGGSDGGYNDDWSTSWQGGSGGSRGGSGSEHERPPHW